MVGEELQVAFFSVRGEEGVSDEGFELGGCKVEAAQFFGDLVLFEADSQTEGDEVVALVELGGRLLLLEERHRKAGLVREMQGRTVQVIRRCEHDIARERTHH